MFLFQLQMRRMVNLGTITIQAEAILLTTQLATSALGTVTIEAKANVNVTGQATSELSC